MRTPIETRRAWYMARAEQENRETAARYAKWTDAAPPVKTWQDIAREDRARARVKGPWNPRYHQGASVRRWCEDVSASGLRVEIENATEKVYRRHTGYYCDDWQSEITHGIVARLPGGRGFLAGYVDPCNEGAACFDMEIAPDADTAARWADSMAERYAEDERDHSEAYRKGADYADLSDELRETQQRRAAAILDARARRLNRRESAAWRALKAALRADRDTIARLKLQRVELADEVPWHLVDTFREAAGLYNQAA